MIIYRFKWIGWAGLLLSCLTVGFQPYSLASETAAKPVARKVESYDVKNGVIYAVRNRTLSAIDPSTQKELWNIKGRGNIAGTKVEVWEGVIYYQTSDSKGTSLMALDPSNQEKLWEYRYVQDDLVRPRCFVDGSRGIVAYEGNETFLRILRADTGDQLWAYNNYIYNVNVVPIQPLITDKYVIYGDSFSGLSVFDAASGRKLFSKLYGSIQGFYYTDGVIFWWSLTGNRHSHLNVTNPAKPSQESLSVDFRNRIDDTLFVKRTMYYTTYDRGALSALDLVTFDKKWEFAPTEERRTNQVKSSIIYANGKLYLAGLDENIYAIDFKTGKVLWSAGLKEAAREMKLDGDKLFFLDGKNNLYCLAAR